MPLKSFKKINREKERIGEQLFANPRNAAAGTLKHLDPGVVAERNLDIFCYGIGAVTGKVFKTHWEALNYLKDAGFKVNPNRKLCEKIEDVIDYCDEWETKRDDLGYDIDGMVVK